MASNPLKIGLLVGREWSFPPAFLEEVNNRDEGVVAEYVKVGGTKMNEPTDYRVIVDRISHEVPYYRSYLKNAALQGVKVVNDPFMWTSDDKFFDASLAELLGVAHPKTMVLPNHSYVPGIVPTESLRNLIYPLEWDKLVDYVGGFPVILKDAHGGGWQGVYVAHTMEELWHYYNQSGLLTMVLQEYIQWDNYARVMALGQSDLHIMKYKPGRHGSGRYFEDHDFSPELYQRIHTDSIKLVQALGYDMNTVEFAVKDGVPYAIDFMNPAPDMDVNSLGKKNFDWMVTHMADMTLRFAKDGLEATGTRYFWFSMVKGIAGSLSRKIASKKPASAADGATPAKRGRKPGSKNAVKSTENVTEGSATPAKRGRKPGSKNAVKSAKNVTEGGATPAKRGRKPGSKNAVKSTKNMTEGGATPAKRGRKPGSKNAVKSAAKPVTVMMEDGVTPVKRGRGRPRKDGTIPAVKPTAPKESSTGSENTP